MRIEATEKEIEDLLCKNIWHFLRLRLVGRQIITPAGIVDVLARCPSSGTYWVIELKKDKLCTKSYAQVMRYTLYFNHNKNKEGKRLFMPMLIGPHLCDELSMCTEYYEVWGSFNDPELCRYRLFDFDPLKGASFDFINKTNEEYTNKNFDNTLSFFDRSLDEADYLRHKLEKNAEELKLKVIEGGK